MNVFNLAEYVKKSTISSGVDIKVKNKESLSAIVALITKK